MTRSQLLRQYAEDAHRQAVLEKSLRKGAEHRRFAHYFAQLAEAQAWLEERRLSASAIAASSSPGIAQTG
jgi:hypothetical protein